MGDRDTEILRAVRAELQETNKLLGGISGFLGNITLWGLLAALLFALGTQFAPGFFLTLSAIVAILGIALALSSLQSSRDSSPSTKKWKREEPVRSGKGLAKLTPLESWLIVLIPIVLVFGFVIAGTIISG